MVWEMLLSLVYSIWAVVRCLGVPVGLCMCISVDGLN